MATSPTGELVRKEVSIEERRRVEEDPVVRQTMELFNGIVVSVQRRASVGASEKAE